MSQVRDQLAVVRVCHDQLADAVAAGTVTVATLVRAEPVLLTEIAKPSADGAVTVGKLGDFDARVAGPASA